ncbi:putative protein SSX6 [Tamandua tetradactyla]|uniref:putative protein SSX6 n=1 Tax=Tamandua tetradactyla TaxID=48850 RepID=UPI0040549451
MNSDNSFKKSPKDDTPRVEKKSKAFKNISKYFTEEEWAELGYSEKISYVYLKRNYETMTKLGLNTTLPDFMCPNRRPIRPKREDYVENWTSGNQDEPPQVTSNVQQRKILKSSLSLRFGIIALTVVPSLLTREMPLMLFICDFHVKKVMPQKPSEEKDGSKGAPGESVLKSNGLDSEQPQKQLCPTGKASTSGPRKEEIKVWTHRLRERKNLVAYEEISDPEEDD